MPRGRGARRAMAVVVAVCLTLGLGVTWPGETGRAQAGTPATPAATSTASATSATPSTPSTPSTPATVPTPKSAAALALASDREVVIDNGRGRGRVRFDVDGNAIDAHDGEIVQFGDRYFLYGTAYGCGYVRFATPATPFCGFRVYESGDLTHWVDRGPLFDATSAVWQQRCNSLTLSCYRPHVVLHPGTGQYILWINAYDVDNGYHVLVSDAPTGPFTEVDLPTLAHPKGGDHDLFVDDDGTAYIAHTVRPGYGMAVERLDPGMRTGTGAVVNLGLSKVEAPSLFKRGATYYLTLSDPGCAYCAGTGTTYFTAPSPLGPWTRAGSLSKDSCGGQPADVAMLRSAAGVTYLYQSDRWNRRSPNEALAGHYWEPLQFAADGTIRPLTCAATHRATIPVAGVAPSSVHGMATSSTDMSWTCDVTSRRARAQTFTVRRAGTLSGVSLVAFRRGTPSARLVVSVHRTRSGRPVGSPVWRTSLPAVSLSWAPQRVQLAPDVRLPRGAYAVVLATSARGSARTCFGTVTAARGKSSAVAGRGLLGARVSKAGGAVRWRAAPGDHGIWVDLR